jgi:hypothetical protein
MRESANFLFNFAITMEENNIFAQNHFLLFWIMICMYVCMLECMYVCVYVYVCVCEYMYYVCM